MRFSRKAVAPSRSRAGFLVIERKWRDGDRVEITMPMHLYSESMPDNPDRIALLYGRTGLSLGATGGIHTPEDAIKLLLACAVECRRA